MTSTSSSIEKNNITNVIENIKMNSNEENSHISPGYNQGINNNKNIITDNNNVSTIVSSLTTTNAISSSNSADFPINTTTNLSSAANKNTSSRSNPAGSIKDLDNLNEHQLKELLDEAFSYKNPKDRENKSETFRQMLENVEQEKDRIPSKHGGSLQDLVEAQAVHNDLILDYEYTYNNRNRRHHHNSRPKKYCSLVSARQREGGSLPSNVNVSNCNLTVYEPSFLNEVLNKRRIGGGGGGGVNSGGLISNNKNDRTVSVNSGNNITSGNSSIGIGVHDTICGKDIELISNNSSIGGNNSADTIIDIGENYTDEKHLLAVDSSKKGYPNSMEDDCIEIGIQLNNNKKFIPRAPGFNAAHQGKLEHTAPEPRHYVDEPITFAALERGKTIVDSTCLPLNENYTSCKSLMGEKSELVKPLYTSTKNITNKCDENGFSLTSTINTSSSSQSQAKAKKKKSQSDRNTKTYFVTNCDGNRGADPVDVLVKYIENTEDYKKNDKANKLNENKRKDKKKDKKNNNNNKKFKKSNSLEELRSCTKLDEDEKQEIVGNASVTMRNKNTNKQNNKYTNNNNSGCGAAGIGSNVCSSTSSNSSTQSNSNEIKNDDFKQQQINHNKRGERRSWGTEELTYLGENNAIEEVREKAKDKEKKKSKDLQQVNATVTANINNAIDISSLSFQPNDNKMSKKKSDPISLSRISIDSLQCESAAEFHVVTKKKKSKKRQTNSDVSSEYNNRNSTGGLSSGGYGNNNNNKYKDGGANSFGNQNKRYGNFSNDHDLYLHSFNTNKDKKSRRKSTSSMPPSEKSDSSDLESVHSLPIESTTSSSSITRNNNNNNNNNQSAHTTKSYADMARSNAAAAAAAEAAANSALGDKLDKWPTVSGGNDSSSSTSSGSVVVVGGGGGNGAGGNGAGGNGNIKNISHKKSSATNNDFPELLSDKLNNNDPGNKPILYSQSLSTTEDRKNNQSSSSVVPLIINEKYINNNNATSIKSPILKPSTVTVASMTDGLRSNEIKSPPVILTAGISGNKQILQKSKSVETDNYYNSMDQYPALEKTVKRHITPIVTAPILTHQSQHQQQNIVNINNNQIHGAIPIITHQIQQQQQQSAIIGNIKQTPKSVITNLSNTILPFTSNCNNTVIPNIGNLTIIQSPQLLNTNDNKSKIIIINPTSTTDLNPINLNNVVLAGNTITSATSSSNNLNHNIINNNNNIIIGKKSLTKQQLNNNNQLNNAKVIDNISSNIESSSSSSPIIIQSNDQLMQNSNIDNTIINNQLTNRKISKNVATVTTNMFDGQSTASAATGNNNNQNFRKYKRGDNKNQQNGNKNQEKLCNSLMSSSTNHHKNQQNISSRPAVIILNDDSSSLSISNEFTFGDFKEEELRFYNSNNINNNNNNNINENCDNGNIVVGNTQADTIIGNYSSVNNTSGTGIYGNTTNLSQLTNNDNNLDDSGAQFSFGSIGNIDTAINCNIIMNSTDIIHDNEQQQSLQQQQQHNLSSPNSDYGYSSLSVNNRSVISDDNSIDISNKLSSTAHDIENNNSIQDVDDSITSPQLAITSNINNVSNILLSNHRIEDDHNDNVKTNNDMLSLKNCNQKSTSCSPIKQSSLIENSSTSTILSNTFVSSVPSSSSSCLLDSNKNIIISNIDIDKTNNNATAAAITGQIANTNRNRNSNNNLNINNNNSENQRRSIKEVNVRYVAPSQELNSMNFDKIVDFVGLAWEEIAHGNRGTQFYNGQ